MVAALTLFGACGPRSFINPHLSHAGSCGGWQEQSQSRLQDIDQSGVKSLQEDFRCSFP